MHWEFTNQLNDKLMKYHLSENEKIKPRKGDKLDDAKYLPNKDEM